MMVELRYESKKEQKIVDLKKDQINSSDDSMPSSSENEFNDQE